MTVPLRVLVVVVITTSCFAGWLWLGMSTFRHDLHKLPRGYVSLITGSHVRARQYQEVFEIPFGALFGDALLTPSNELIKQLCKDIHLLAHSLQCTAVSERSSTNLVSSFLLRMCSKMAVAAIVSALIADLQVECNLFVSGALPH